MFISNITTNVLLTSCKNNRLTAISTYHNTKTIYNMLLISCINNSITLHTIYPPGH